MEAGAWFNGMQGSRLVTTQVVELLARLKSMHIMADAQVAGMYLKGLNYLENAFCQEYENLKKNEARNKSPQWPSEPGGEVSVYYIAGYGGRRKSKQGSKGIHDLQTGKPFCYLFHL